jgi:hypothetical protein
MEDKIEVLEHALKIVREILVIIVLIGLIVAGFSTLSAIQDVSNNINNSEELFPTEDELTP